MLIISSLTQGCGKVVVFIYCFKLFRYNPECALALSRRGRRPSVNYRDPELLRIQAEVLYVHDERGRLLRVNETDADEPAPRFFLARSTAGNIWRVRFDVPDDLVAELEHLAAAEPIADDLRKPPRHADQYGQLLARQSPLADVYSGPAYWLPQLDPPPGTVTITRENRSLLAASFPYTLSTLNDRLPVVVVVEDGAAVAACFSARATASGCEAGVYTLEAWRGRGYAAQTVRGWSAAVRATGRLPLYSTSWDNIASEAVARKLSAVQYGVDFSIT